MRDEETRARKMATEIPQVTVICVTYNQKKYIGEALDSFVSQKTTFPFKVFVGDDCSSDSTPDIIRSYAERYPDIIVPFIRETNLGSKRNGMDMCAHASTPYIAFCDGDDYWCDDHMLQKLWEYLEDHPDYKLCYGRTEILPCKNWDLADYYKADEDGRYIVPDCVPGYKRLQMPLTSKDFITNTLNGHTSSYLFRWDYTVTYPEWFYEGQEGHVPLRLMHLKDGEAGYIDDIVSVYRVNETGVYTSYKTQEELFYNTRLDYVRWISGLLSWYEEEGIEDYPKTLLTNRLIKEINNLNWACSRLGQYEPLIELAQKYPNAAHVALEYYLSANKDRRMLEGALTWEGYKLYVRSLKYRRRLGKKARRTVKWRQSAIGKFVIKSGRSWRRKRKNLKLMHDFHKFGRVPKQKNLWVVSGFRGRSYMDNARYFYEYVLERHPEIEIYWFTVDGATYNQLKKEGKPVIGLGRPECVDIMSRASLAVVDHYNSTDFPRASGFNAGTKVAQLWHGVALKSFVKDGKVTAGEPTVIHSSDLIAGPEDGALTRLVKRWRHWRYAYRREMFEEYLLFLTPGPEMQHSMGPAWHIPESAYFMSGYPRVAPLFDVELSEEQKAHPCVLYAPTYRWNPKMEMAVLDGFLDACSQIQELMETVDGTFALRMHPHTWRNYRSKILSTLSKYDRIFFDDEKDAYAVLPNYTVAISDYSSIVLDYSLMKRPVVFYTPDFEEYNEKDCSVISDYGDRIPGPWTRTWEETLREVRAYIEDPRKDYSWTSKRMEWFYNPETTDRDNAGRIVEELKRRLGMEGASND